MSSYCIKIYMKNHTLIYTFRLLFGVMYPAYASYKTVKNKHVKNYVRKCSRYIILVVQMYYTLALLKNFNIIILFLH